MSAAGSLPAIMTWISTSLGLAAVLGVATVCHAEMRQWTNTVGKVLQAEFAGVEGGRVLLILASGGRVKVELQSLSAADQAWVRAQPPPATTVDAPPSTSSAGLPPPERRRMPDQVKEPLLYTSIRVIREKPGDCLYESEHFQFKTTAKLGVALMKDICRAFESTYELVRLMPWGIQPRPEEGRSKFQAEFYETREQYLATGAPTWSAGVYSLKDKVFRIPFEELGISAQPGAGGAYYRKGAVNNDTITHEITHQMMHGYVPYMPIWLVEGLAEYTSNLPYRSGVFQVGEDASAFAAPKGAASSRRGLFNFMVQRQRPGWIGVERLWTYTTDITTANPITRFTLTDDNLAPPASPDAPPSALTADIGSNYRSGHLLAFFLVRDRDGLPLKRYFDALRDEAAKWPPFWKALDNYKAALEKLRPAYVAYETEMEAFLLKPGVTKLDDGRISYPNTLTPPADPPELPKPPLPPDRTDPKAVCAKHLGILLDGRSLAQLNEEVMRMFMNMGCPLQPGD